MVPHFEENLESRGIPILGTLLWWDLASVDTRHIRLAEVAEEVGFPALWLPVPVSRGVAFSRAIIKGCANATGKWRADLVTPNNEEKSAALLQEWAPRDTDDPEPWKGRARIVLAESGDPRATWLDPTTQDRDDAADTFARILAHFRRQLDYATADEVRMAAHHAMREVRAIKVRPGMWFGQKGRAEQRAKATAAWLRHAGGSTAGAIDLADVGGNRVETTRYATEGIAQDVAQAVADAQEAVNDLKRGASLRDRLQALADVRAQISDYTEFLGATADALRAQITTAQDLLDRAAKERGLDLDDAVSRGVTAAMQRVLDATAKAAAAHDADAMRKATQDLRKRQGAANQSAFGDAWGQLRKLADAAIESMDFRGVRRATTEVLKAHFTDDESFDSMAKAGS